MDSKSAVVGGSIPSGRAGAWSSGSGRCPDKTEVRVRFSVRLPNRVIEVCALLSCENLASESKVLPSFSFWRVLWYLWLRHL